MTDRLFVVGNPVSHSLSPFIHNYWLGQYEINGIYEIKRIENVSALADIVARVRKGEVKGVNVTVPHKEAILPHLDALTPAAQVVGAANVVFLRDGAAIGDNTDAEGFYAGLLGAIPHFDGRGKTATLVGAGGAARAALWALQENGFSRVYVHNRTREKAERLAADFPAVARVRRDDSPPTDLLANVTSLGMVGQNALRLNHAWVTPGGIVYDIVYRPRVTPLLADAKEAGLRVVGGLTMLERQAAAAFRRWYGIMPEKSEELMAKLVECAEV
ncbi:MAG: shikimate dehydrogenase [Rickettsiales bacterium]